MFEAVPRSCSTSCQCAPRPPSRMPVDCPDGQRSLRTRHPNKRRPRALSPWVEEDSLTPTRITDQVRAAEALRAWPHSAHSRKGAKSPKKDFRQTDLQGATCDVAMNHYGQMVTNDHSLRLIGANMILRCQRLVKVLQDWVKTHRDRRPWLGLRHALPRTTEAPLVTSGQQDVGLEPRTDTFGCSTGLDAWAELSRERAR